MTRGALTPGFPGENWFGALFGKESARARVNIGKEADRFSLSFDL